MVTDIQVLEKPDWVSWDEVHEVVWQSHEMNRRNGINMLHASFSGKEIAEYLAPSGKMFVALLGSKVIGTAAYTIKVSKFWFGEYRFAYCCFASVLPGFTGRGVYKRLTEKREESVMSQGLDKLLFNTHPSNSRVIHIAMNNGYKKVDFVLGNTVSWVYMVKWLKGTPYSDFKLSFMFNCIRIVRLMKQFVKTLLPVGSK